MVHCEAHVVLPIALLALRGPTLAGICSAAVVDTCMGAFAMGVHIQLVVCMTGAEGSNNVNHLQSCLVL